jgi:hypothetical protein
MAVLDELVRTPKPWAGAYALKVGGRYQAICQANSTRLPGYAGRVLRVRHIVLAPAFDFGDYSVKDYSRVLVSLFTCIYALSRKGLPSAHIKFHLASPADLQFFSMMGNALGKVDVFKSVEMKGAWLYITKK